MNKTYIPPKITLHYVSLENSFAAGSAIIKIEENKLYYEDWEDEDTSVDIIW